jgi:hypothetical protein
MKTNVAKTEDWSTTTRPTVLYFGCIDRPGHYLWHLLHGRLSWREFRLTPWGDHIDGGVFGDSKSKHEAGRVHVQKKDGWTAVAWADYSVDRRPGSHSTFLVHADVTAEELIAMAREQWPQVFNRGRFPELLTA